MELNLGQNSMFITPASPQDILIIKSITAKAEHVFPFSRIELSPEEESRFQEIQAKLASGYPLDYILKHIQFLNLRITLSEDVLIPRPETEQWVQQIIEKRLIEELDLVVDIGCGSGVIGLSFAQQGKQVFLSDISMPALEIAKQNAADNNLESVAFYISNLLENTDLQRDIKQAKSWALIANLPYVPESDKETAVVNKINFEPALALYSGSDGLDVFRDLLKQVKLYHLYPAHMYFELDPRNIDAAEEMLSSLGYQTEIWRDYNDFKRVLLGRL
jgi:release factor glutamine methyltransferase